MNIREMLQNALEARQKKLAKLQERSQASEDIAEVRSIGVDIDEVNVEIRELNTQLQALEAEERNVEGSPKVENRQAFDPIKTYTVGDVRSNETLGGTDSIEYRTAFMNNVIKHIPISNEVRANANTLTSDVTTAIPTLLVNRIIERMDEVGMILPLVTHTTYASGIVIPTSNVKPVASWVSEGATSDKQKKTTGSISFSHFKLRCEISMTMEVGTMALAVFENKFVENVANAMVKAREQAIINGNGTSQSKGILTETPNEGRALTVAKTGKLDYKLLCDVEAAVPTECEGTAKWAMNKKTFMAFMAMTDENGQPIARVNYGVGGTPERTLLGREVVVNPYVPSYADGLAQDTIFAFIFDFTDYVENTIYDMGISKKQDWDTEDLLTKAVMSVDGKVIDKTSLITLTKKADGTQPSK